jgi:hypothetical protein
MNYFDELRAEFIRILLLAYYYQLSLMLCRHVVVCSCTVFCVQILIVLVCFLYYIIIYLIH